MFRRSFCGAAALTALLLASAPAFARAGSAAPACAADSDLENLCRWSGPAGTKGRTCEIDVEHIRKDHPCDFSPTTGSISDHHAMCFSASAQEHITFVSSSGRKFRIRRFVPIDPEPNGLTCPQHPFQRHFVPDAKGFDGPRDTQQVAANVPEGCQYKLEVQFKTIDANAPKDPSEGNARYECRDPHLQMMK